MRERRTAAVARAPSRAPEDAACALVAAVDLQAAACAGDLPAAERPRLAGHGARTSVDDHTPWRLLLLGQLSSTRVSVHHARRGPAAVTPTTHSFRRTVISTLLHNGFAHKLQRANVILPTTRPG
jgi:hypothetical protein